jgi:hypothetical protein
LTVSSLPNLHAEPVYIVTVFLLCLFFGLGIGFRLRLLGELLGEAYFVIFERILVSAA